MAVVVLTLVSCVACSRDDERASDRTAAISAPSVDGTLDRLPPQLRDRFESSAGRAELKRALEDSERLKVEARRLRLHERPEVRQQVQELEDRLIVQQLLKEEFARLEPAEDEQRAFYNARQALFQEPERVRVVRVFAASRGDPPAARARAEALRKRWLSGENLDALLRESDGGERGRGGDLGFVTTDHADAALAKVAFSLNGEAISEVTPTNGGFSVMKVVERSAPRVIPFDEARPLVLARMKPTLERKAFDALVGRLREARD